MNLLITGAWKPSDEQLETIKSLGYNVVIMNDEKAELPCLPQDINAVVCNGLFLYHDISGFSSLRFVQLTSAGYDRISLKYAKNNGITVYNAGTAYATPMAEFVVASVMRFYKQFSFFEENQRNKVWSKNRNIMELFGKTVCIVGCGNVGNETARLFKMFGCNIIGVNRTVKSESAYYDKILPLDEIKNAFAVADVIVLSVALTKETKSLVGKDELHCLQDGAVLVNVARGRLVDMNALRDELSSGRIYAALDVFEEEPLSLEDPLWSLENVFITPHNSFVGDENMNRLWNIIFGNLRKFNENLGGIS